MSRYYTASGSQGKYISIWKRTIPAISKLLSEDKLKGSIELDSEDFTFAGNRKSYSFNLEFSNGSVSNNIDGSAVARDLATVLTRNGKIERLLMEGKFKFNMDKNFTLWISKPD